NEGSQQMIEECRDIRLADAHIVLTVEIDGMLAAIYDMQSSQPHRALLAVRLGPAIDNQGQPQEQSEEDQPPGHNINTPPLEGEKRFHKPHSNIQHPCNIFRRCSPPGGKRLRLS